MNGLLKDTNFATWKYVAKSLIYIYIYICVCVCVCVYDSNHELGTMDSYLINLIISLSL